MELILIFALIIGGGLVWYLNRYAKESILKEARREASHIRSIEAIEYELEKLNAEWQRFGILSEKDKAFMDALHSRRYDLQRQK